MIAGETEDFSSLILSHYNKSRESLEHPDIMWSLLAKKMLPSANNKREIGGQSLPLCMLLKEWCLCIDNSDTASLSDRAADLYRYTVTACQNDSKAIRCCYHAVILLKDAKKYSQKQGLSICKLRKIVFIQSQTPLWVFRSISDNSHHML
jgi:hypothetical protein